MVLRTPQHASGQRSGGRGSSGAPLALALACVCAAALWAPRAAGTLQENPQADEPWLGLTLQALTPPLMGELELIDDRGALIADVVEGSPADRAGLRPLDVIIGAENRVIEGPAELLEIVRAHRPGDTMALVVWRDAQQLHVSIELAAPPGASRGAAAEAPTGASPARGGRRPHLGVQVVGLPENLARYFRAKPYQGVLVTHVEEGSAAAQAGLLPGDVILELDGRPTRDPFELRDALEAVGPGRWGLRILRRGHRRGVRVELESHPAPSWIPTAALDFSRIDWERLREELGRGTQAARRQLEALKKEASELREAIEKLEDEVRQEIDDRR